MSSAGQTVDMCCQLNSDTVDGQIIFVWTGNGNYTCWNGMEVQEKT